MSLSSNFKEFPMTIQQPDSSIGDIKFISYYNIPNGWMECDGRALSRTIFVELFNKIGTAFGAGDGISTFNIPDLRGRFIRGLDDGTGIDPGRILGSEQIDAFQGHEVQVHVNNYDYSGASIGAYISSGSKAKYDENVFSAVDGEISRFVTDGVNGTPRTASETRPRNVALIPIIKVKNIAGYDPYVYRGNALTLGGIPASGFLLASQGVNRNAIINGNGMVQQRASAALSTSAQYGIDRWAAYASGTAVSAGIFGQSTSGPIGRTGYGIALTNATITGTGTVYFRYRIEAKDAPKFMNQPAAFSCLVYHDVGSTVNYTVTINKPSSTADVFSPVTAIGSFVTSVASGTSTRLSFAVTNMGACGDGIEILISAACGGITTKNFYLTEAQFELGTVATAFEYRPFQQELAECQRYYEKSYDIDTIPGTANTAGLIVRAYNSGNSYWYTIFKVTKRTIPTVTLYSPVTGSSGYIRNIDSNTDSAAGACSISTNHYSIIFASSSNVTAWQYTADAEL